MRIVIKVGTSTLAYPTGLLNIRRVEDLCRVMSDLKNAGNEVVLISSGAIGMGVGKLGLGKRPSDIPTKQAAAAVGQCELMYTYDKLFGEYNHTVAQILLANKGYYQALRSFTSAEAHKQAGDISRAHAGNYNTNVGIVGAGMIGKLVINLLKPFKLNLKLFDVFVDAEKARALGCEKVDTLEELFATCDVVSNHLANVPATVGIFKGEYFEKMKENGTFINTGRGAQVDEAGMLAALKKRGDVCAILDVTTEEPPKESDFYDLPNVFMTPHIAGSQANEVARMSELVVDQFENMLNGKPTQYEVTAQMLATMA